MRLEKGTFGLFAAKQLSGIPPLEQTLFSWIAFYKNQDGAFPSVDTLCTRSGVKSKTTVRTAIASLKKRGFLIVQRRKRDNGSDTSNDYDPVFLDEEAMTLTDPKEEVPTGGDQILGGEGSNFDPPITKKNSLTKEISKKINKKRERVPPAHEIDPKAFALETIPELAQGEAFMREWLEFCRLRLEPPAPKRPAPLTVRAAELIVAKLKRWGRRAAILSLQKSIIPPWQDVFWPKELGPEPPPGLKEKKSPSVTEGIRAAAAKGDQAAGRVLEKYNAIIGNKGMPSSTYDEDLRARAEAGDARAKRILETKL